MSAPNNNTRTCRGGCAGSHRVKERDVRTRATEARAKVAQGSNDRFAFANFAVRLKFFGCCHSRLPVPPVPRVITI